MIKLIKSLISHLWLAIIFSFSIYLIYHMAIQKKTKDIFEMTSKIQNLKKEKQLALIKKEDLQLKFQSQSDPAWIEVVLMKELGVVPENQIKVHFAQENLESSK